MMGEGGRPLDDVPHIRIDVWGTRSGIFLFWGRRTVRAWREYPILCISRKGWGTRFCGGAQLCEVGGGYGYGGYGGGFGAEDAGA
jgi:hypothetical protein